MSDLIDRQTAIDAILHITNCKSVRELFEYNQLHHLTEMWSGGVNDAIDAVIGVDSAQLGTNLAEVGMDTISRRSAIDAVTDELDMIDHVPQWVFNRLEKRLKQLPSAQPEPNLDEWCDSCKEYDKEKHCCPRWNRVIRQALADAQPQRTGKWIPSDSQCGIRCSACGAPVDDFCHSIDYIDLVYEPNFCPNCGVKMEGVKDESN